MKHRATDAAAARLLERIRWALKHPDAGAAGFATEQFVSDVMARVASVKPGDREAAAERLLSVFKAAQRDAAGAQDFAGEPEQFVQSVLAATVQRSPAVRGINYDIFEPADVQVFTGSLGAAVAMAAPCALAVIFVAFTIGLSPELPLENLGIIFAGSL